MDNKEERRIHLENNQLTKITFNLENNYKIQVQEFTDEQKKKFKELEVNMLAGNLLGIGAETLKRLEKEEKPFIIQNKKKNYVLIFKFIDSLLVLENILEYDQYVFN